MQNIRFGSYVPYYLPVQDGIRCAQLMEKVGLDSLWVGDHLEELDAKIPAFDPWCTLSVYGLGTRRLMLATCVTDPHRRHPAVLAQSALTVQHISNGRVILGIGPGEAMNLDPFGIPWDHPVSRLEEVIRLTRMLISGDEVTFTGRFYRLNGAYLQLARAIPNLDKFPIYVAANSPLSRKVAGILADGWLTLSATAETYKADLQEVLMHAKSAGREPDSIDASFAANAAISKDRDEARRRVENPARALALSFPNQMRKQGVVITDKFDWMKLIPRPGLQREITQELEDVEIDRALSTCVYGTPDDCIESISKFEKAGVRHLILAPHGPYEDFFKLLGERVLPYFRNR